MRCGACGPPGDRGDRYGVGQRGEAGVRGDRGEPAAHQLTERDHHVGARQRRGDDPAHRRGRTVVEEVEAPRVHVQHHRHPKQVREPGQRGLAHEAARGRHVDVHQVGPAHHHLGRVAHETAGERQRLGGRRAVAVRGDVPDAPALPEPCRRQRPHAGGDATLGGRAGGDPEGARGTSRHGAPTRPPRPRVEPAVPASSRGCASYQAETSSGVIPPGSPPPAAPGRAVNRTALKRSSWPTTMPA